MRLWALREDDRSSLEMSEKGDSLESILNLQRSMLLEALTLYRQVDGSNHPIVADVLCDLASESEATGREHEEYARASLGLRKQLLGSNSLEVADSLVALANAVAFETNRYPEAQGHYLEALAIRTNRLPPDVYDVCSLYYSLADCQERNGHFAAAEQSLLHAAINDFHPDEGFVWFFARRRLILLLRKRGALPEAEERCREVLRIAREGSEPLPGELVISVQNQLAWILLDEGKLDEAQGLARDVLNSVEQTAPGGRRRFSIAQLILGAVLLEQKKYSDAEPLLISGYEEIKQHADELPNYRPLRENALQRITQLYKLWDEAVPGSGKSAQAEIWLERLEALKRTEASTKSSSD
jgi:tetratricopeptide (TPR) repeat protein